MTEREIINHMRRIGDFSIVKSTDYLKFIIDDLSSFEFYIRENKEFKLEIEISDYRRELDFFKNFNLNYKSMFPRFNLRFYPSDFNKKMENYLTNYVRLRSIIVDILRISYDGGLNNLNQHLWAESIIHNLKKIKKISNFPLVDYDEGSNYLKKLIDILSKTKKSFYYELSPFVDIKWDNYLQGNEFRLLTINIFSLPIIRVYEKDINKLSYNSTSIKFLISLLYHYKIHKVFLAKLQKESLESLINIEE